MPEELVLIAAAALVLLLGATDLPERTHRSRTLAGISESVRRIIRAGGLRCGPFPLLAASAGAGALAGKLGWAFSMPLALVLGLAAALAPLTVLWLRASSHELRIERETIAAARVLAAHLGAGENLYRAIRQISGQRDDALQAALGLAADEFGFDRPLAAALIAASDRSRHRSLSLLLAVLAQLAQQGAQGREAADVLDLVARQMEQALRARRQLAERTRGVAIQIYAVAGAIPIMAVWLWQTSPYRFSVFELPLGRTVLLPFGIAMELLGLALLWRWTRPDSL